jgi:hypothetical protein
MVLKLFFRCSAMSLSLRMTAKLFRVRNGWKSLNMKMAGSTCSMTWSSAASGSLVAALRFSATGWTRRRARCRCCNVHSKTFFCRFLAISDDEGSARASPRW